MMLLSARERGLDARSRQIRSYSLIQGVVLVVLIAISVAPAVNGQRAAVNFGKKLLGRPTGSSSSSSAPENEFILQGEKTKRKQGDDHEQQQEPTLLVKNAPALYGLFILAVLILSTTEVVAKLGNRLRRLWCDDATNIKTSSCVIREGERIQSNRIESNH